MIYSLFEEVQPEGKHTDKKEAAHVDKMTEYIFI